MTDERGFTLVELLVSLAILAIALAVLFGAISDSLDRVRRDRDDSAATSLAQSLLDRAGTDLPLAPAEGTTPGGYRWSLAVKPYGGTADAKAWNTDAVLVRATVRWRDGALTRTRSLLALKLAPRKAAP